MVTKTALKPWPATLFAAFVLVLVSCAEVPVTGRNQLLLLSESDLNAMSFQGYRKFMATHPLSDDQQAAEMVRRVGRRIADAVERYLAARGKSHILQGYRWEFNLVEGKEMNAWCMPGGKVVVYTGLLPVVKNETGLAVVLGHEIAHAVARHGNERISQELALRLGGAALSTALSGASPVVAGILKQAYGLGADLGVLLPYSRVQETEADRLGLIFMAMAGYDPRAALDFWKRMLAAEKGPRPPELLSTHPSGRKRLENITRFLPEALKYYNGPVKPE